MNDIIKLCVFLPHQDELLSVKWNFSSPSKVAGGCGTVLIFGAEMSHVCACLSAFLCILLYVIHEWWCMMKGIVCTGGWRTTRPTWQRGPYGRNFWIHVFCTYKHTQVLVQLGWNDCKEATQTSTEKTHYELWIRLSCYTSACSFAGEAWKERLHRRTWSWRFGGESYFILEFYGSIGSMHKYMEELLLWS